MGMYTEIRTNFTLRPDVPVEVHQTLKRMLDQDGEEVFPNFVPPEHELFRDTRWASMLKCGSAYFDTEPSHLYLPTPETLIHGRERPGAYWHLQSVSNFKNYDNEVALFVDWIRPYCLPQEGPIVTSLYEEATEETEYFIWGTILGS